MYDSEAERDVLAIAEFLVFIADVRMYLSASPVRLHRATHTALNVLNPLTGTIKPQSNGPLYSNTVIGTLAVDGSWVGCYIWYREEGPERAAAALSALLAVDVTAHSSTASMYQLLIIRCGSISTFAL